jgi:uncharacterized protein
VDRRRFLRTGSLLAASACTGRAFPQSLVPAATQTGEEILTEFHYSQVSFPQGPLRTQVEQNIALLLSLEDERLLKPIRQRAGLPAPGDDMGGWYDNYPHPTAENNYHGAIPAHSFGQYLSALARFYVSTGDPAIQAKVHRLVVGFAQTIDNQGKFWREYPQPAYTHDKNVCGLIDAHIYCASPHALPAMKLATDAILPYLPEKSETREEQEERLAREGRPNKGYDETYTLPENQFRAWSCTSDVRYKELAVRFLADRELFDPLAADRNVLPGTHAYSHVNALCSAVQAYLVLGSQKHLRAARNGFRMVQEQSYATGGWGPNEFLLDPNAPSIGPQPNDNAFWGQSALRGGLGESLIRTHHCFETPCGSYAHFKICRYLMRITRHPRYGDSMERVFYNTVMGAKPIQKDGRTFYYSDYNNKGAKVFYPSAWPCCSGTLPQVTADYRISTYFQGSRGIYVNLFVPSTLSWQSRGRRFSLTQTTHYPFAEDVHFSIAASSPAEFSLFLRIPAWASGAAISVNGHKLEEPQAATFCEIRREWKDGDIVTLTIPLRLTLEAVDHHHPKTLALLYGPLVLFPVDPVRQPVLPSVLLGARQAGPAARSWIAQDGPKQIRFKPFFEIGDEPYQTYMTVA